MTEDEMRQTLIEHGFLAPVVIQEFPAKYRQMASGWFEMAENFSRIGQRVALRAMNQGHGAADARGYGTALFLRTLQSYQAAILLCSMGLSADARMLIRTGFENSFCIAALLTRPTELVKALEDDHKAAQKAQVKFIVAEPGRMVDLDDETREKLLEFANTIDQRWSKVRQLSVDETAKATALKDAYLYYKMLSNDASHPSVTSLSRHITPQPDGSWDYQLGPVPGDQIADTINIACSAIMGALIAFTELVNDTEGNTEAAAAVAAYSRVNDAMPKASPQAGPR